MCECHECIYWKACCAGYCCDLYMARVGRTIDYFPFLTACIVTSDTKNVSSQRREFGSDTY